MKKQVEYWIQGIHCKKDPKCLHRMTGQQDGFGFLEGISGIHGLVPLHILVVIKRTGKKIFVGIDETKFSDTVKKTQLPTCPYHE